MWLDISDPEKFWPPHGLGIIYFRAVGIFSTAALCTVVKSIPHSSEWPLKNLPRWFNKGKQMCTTVQYYYFRFRSIHQFVPRALRYKQAEWLFSFFLFFNSVPYSFDNIFVNFSTKRTKLRTLFASFSIYNFHRRKFYVKVFVLLKRGKLRVIYHLAMIRSINESLW